MQTPNVDTSPLTEIPSSPPTGNSGNRYELPYGTAQVEGDEAIDVDDSASDDLKAGEELSGEAQICPGCDSMYSDRAALNGHLSDKRSVCGRNLYESSTNQKVWYCPRCDVQMTKKYSTERHIRDSCWKVCDECCESRKAACDAIHSDGPCTHCTEEGKPCTKRTEPPVHCEAEMVMIPLAQLLNSAPRSTKNGAIPGGRRLNAKRKAAASPEASSEVTHEIKRPAVVKKKGNATPSHLPLHSATKLSPDISRVTQERTRLWRDDQVLQPNRIGPPGPRSSFPTALIREMEAMPRHVQQAQRFPVGDSGAQQPNSNYPHMQRMQQSQGLAVPSGYHYQPQTQLYQPGGGVPSSVLPMRNYSANAIQTWDNDTVRNKLNATVQGLQHEIQRLKGLETHYPDGMSTQPLVPGHINAQPSMSNLIPSNTHRPDSGYAHGPVSRMELFRRAQTQDVHGSHVTVNAFHSSAPGSRMPSRQSSPLPLRSRRMSTYRLPSLQLRSLSRPPNVVTKGSIVRNSIKPIAVQRSTTPTPNENAPIMRFKIHSNTYDINNTPIFSILTMRASQKFGPRLDAYCQHRKKQYGVDWDFIYQYRTHDRSTEGIRFIKIEYNMTPEDVYDKEYPHLRLQDMGMIMVVKVQPRVLVGVQNDGTDMLSPIGSQVSEEVVDITDGETTIYQNAGTITQWHRDVQSKMNELRTQINSLNAELADQKMTLAQQKHAIAQLQARNAELTRNNHMLGCYPGPHPMAQIWNQQPVPSQHYHTRRPSLSAPPHQVSFSPHQIIPRIIHPVPSQPYMQPNPFYPTSSNTNTAHARDRRPTHNTGSLEPFPDFKEDKITEDALRLLTGKTPGPELHDLSLGQILEMHGNGPLSARARTFAERLGMTEVKVEEGEGDEEEEGDEDGEMEE
ncbi:hypothetical protein PTNB73_06671 [Pyrenophora teres f. teres]|nr:hypothetical protein HRS9139_07432 [Pyrenophora teres f. teres]KAE8829366.1 hypothetical protein HRS9122_09181 [Pyrenophora teres f. teres]KAE8830812.1 hypothetical protein PTNB85_07399 [Pyrenophora teres f. teres]KAE8857190.1 hypothetical protein PTNB29_08257 [Pyrenophora teres f. teres]KAE8863464.1 hypothetical protein PTNB73_06671 [Pyrenophora teres f. teres]